MYLSHGCRPHEQRHPSSGILRHGDMLAMMDGRVGVMQRAGLLTLLVAALVLAHTRDAALSARAALAWRAATTPRAPRWSDDKGTVQPLWTVHVGPNPFALAVDPRTNRVFVLTRGPVRHKLPPITFGPGRLITLDATTGRVLRTAPAGIIPNFLLLDAGTNRVFTFPLDTAETEVADRRRMYNATTGRLLSVHPFQQVLVSALSVRTGRIFVFRRTHWPPAARNDGGCLQRRH